MKTFFLTLTGTVRAASPAIFAFIETTLPYSTPFPIATITMASAGQFFGLKGFGAFLFVYSLEAIGIIFTSKLVDAIVDFIKARNPKSFLMVLVLFSVVAAYITILVSLNVKIHKEITDADFSTALTLICFLPLIAGVLNGINLVKMDYIDSVEEKKMLDEKHYQEQREDKMKLRTLRYQQIAPAPQAPRSSKEKMPGDYKEYLFSLLDGHVNELLDKDGKISLTKITDRINKDKRVEFVHANVKGTWYKFVQEWKSSRQ